MTTKILVDNIKHRFNHAESRQYLQEKYKNKLTIVYSGGMWTITPELISFLRESTTGKSTEILIDNYNNPVEIERTAFLEVAIGVYTAVTTQWLTEYSELSKVR